MLDKQGPLAVPRGVEPDNENKALDEIVSHPLSTEIQELIPQSVPPKLGPAIDCSDVTFPKTPRSYSEHRAKHSWLYVMTCETFTKIGLATDPILRLASLTGSIPFQVALHNAYRVPRDIAVLSESWCHRKLHAYWHRAEWFAVEPEDALAVVKLVAAAASKARRGRTKAFFEEGGNPRGYEISTPAALRNINKPLWVPYRGET